MSDPIAYLREHATLEQDGHAVRLPPEQLERGFYEAVNDVLVRLGGKWNGRKRLHLFPYDVTAAYHAVLSTGILPPKNPTAFFPTPAPLVDDMLRLAELNDQFTVLEPSAGTGAIADAVRATGAAVHCCEVLDLNRAALTAKGHQIVGGDFLAYNPGPTYDAVLMNPPFSLDGDKLAYITHIEHAWTLLKSGGVLVAIAPPGFTFRQDKRSQDFLQFVNEHGEWTRNPPGAFKESGTGIETVLIYARKSDQGWRRGPYHGFSSWHAWAGALWAENHTDEVRKKAEHAATQAPPGEVGEGFRAVMREVIAEARKSGDPLSPLDADLLEIQQHLRAALALIEEVEAELHTPPPPQPEPEPERPQQWGPLFSLEAS